MKNAYTALKNFMKDESGQGTAEYILLLVAVVMVAFIFKGKIKEIITGKMEEVGSSIESIKSK